MNPLEDVYKAAKEFIAIWDSEEEDVTDQVDALRDALEAA